MEFSLKPDYEVSKRRYAAFWERTIIDRPPVCIPFTKPNPQPVASKNYETEEARWLDVSFRAAQMEAELENTVFYGDALPIAWPNMGPEIFSAWCGCGYRYGRDTTWSEPCIDDWDADASQAVFDPKHPLFQTTVRFTKELIERGKGKFIVGLTDFHPGADHLAALRDPQTLAYDMIENIDHVQAKLEESYAEFYRVYDIFYEMLREANMPITSWTPLIHEGRFYIPSNDFSCMISKQMFDDLFLPGIVEECRFYERSIYHLDGPDALRHLDSLLSIKELDAVQWVPGAGNEGYERWVEVYQKIQRAGKGIQLLPVRIAELPLIFETLRPEGVWFSGIHGIEDQATADRVLARIEKWT